MHSQEPTYLNCKNILIGFINDFYLHFYLVLEHNATMNSFIQYVHFHHSINYLLTRFSRQMFMKSIIHRVNELLTNNLAYLQYPS